jgi:hypothetical protein
VIEEKRTVVKSKKAERQPLDGRLDKMNVDENV